MADLKGADGGLRELALFAGAGGGILGGKLLGWRTVCAVERDAYAAQVLAQRQNDGILDPFPIWSDVCSFDGRPWRGLVDIVSGGFPCQDISSAGRGAGIEGERSGLWSEFARIIGEVGPRFVFVENSPMLVGRGLGRVLGDLASLGFDAEWGVLGADDAGAPHRRERIWILAHSPSNRYRQGGEIRDLRGQDGRPHGKLLPEPCGHGLPSEVAYPFGDRRQEWRPGWWTTEPALGRVAHGVAHRVDRLKAIGNGQVPQVAALAFRTLYIRLTQN